MGQNFHFFWHWKLSKYFLLIVNFLLISGRLINFRIVSPGSSASLGKSLNGSLKSEGENSGSESDGDNINVVIRVRPISQKEQRANDEGIIQFPGEGQIWVKKNKEIFSRVSHLNSTRLTRPRAPWSHSLSTLCSSLRPHRKMSWSTAAWKGSRSVFISC